MKFWVWCVEVDGGTHYRMSFSDAYHPADGFGGYGRFFDNLKELAFSIILKAEFVNARLSEDIFLHFDVPFEMVITKYAKLPVVCRFLNSDEKLTLRKALSDEVIKIREEIRKKESVSQP